MLVNVSRVNIDGNSNYNTVIIFHLCEISMYYVLHAMHVNQAEDGHNYKLSFVW